MKLFGDLLMDWYLFTAGACIILCGIALGVAWQVVKDHREFRRILSGK